MFGDSFFKRVEKKTNVSKDTILSLANKLQDGNMKDEKTLSEVIDEVGLWLNFGLWIVDACIFILRALFSVIKAFIAYDACFNSVSTSFKEIIIDESVGRRIDMFFMRVSISFDLLKSFLDK